MIELIRLKPSGDVYVKQGNRICGPLTDDEWQTPMGYIDTRNLEDATWNFDEDWAEQDYQVLYHWTES